MGAISVDLDMVLEQCPIHPPEESWSENAGGGMSTGEAGKVEGEHVGEIQPGWDGGV